MIMLREMNEARHLEVSEERLVGSRQKGKVGRDWSSVVADWFDVGKVAPCRWATKVPRSLHLRSF